MKAIQLNLINERVKQCTKCPELVADRIKTVFGNGDPNAQLLFCAEAPGKDESISGNVLVGQAGKLFNNILEACKLKREEVYTCNVLKCRPPNNRLPTDEECHNCLPYLTEQINIIQPKIIVALGACASQNLLKTKTPIGRLRGNWYNYEGIPVMPTWHPSYLLRQSAAKKDTWDDMQKVMEKLGYV